MTPFQVFKICQGQMGRKYRGTVDDFELLDCSSYYHSLSDFLTNKFGKNKYPQHQYISVCGNKFGSRFSPFDLMSDEYINAYDEWSSIHKDEDSYKKHILKSIQRVYKFCKDKNIRSLEEYVRRWSVSHIVSEILDENVAFFIKVQESFITKPEKKLIKKKFLSKVKEIQERLERDKTLRELIEKNINILKEKIDN